MEAKTGEPYRIRKAFMWSEKPEKESLWSWQGPKAWLGFWNKGDWGLKFISIFGVKTPNKKMGRPFGARF
jgi:hypothetical protein